MSRERSRVAGRGRRGLLLALVASAVTTIAAASATTTLRAQVPAGSLTFPTWIVYGVGTGIVSSPSALCDVRPDGTALERRSDQIGALSDPAWTRAGDMLAFVAYDRAADQSLLRVTPGTSWRPRTVARGAIRAPAWSPDGRRIAFENRAADGETIHVVNADGTERRVLVASPAATPTWSPDGTRIAYSQMIGAVSGGIWTIDVGSSGRTKLSDDGATPAWSPDGGRVAFVASATGAPTGLVGQEVYTVSPDGSGRKQLSHLTETATGGGVETTLGRPAWSPDGSAIAVVRSRSLRNPRVFVPPTVELFLVDARDGTQTRLLSLDGIGNPAWRPGVARAASSARPCLIRADGTARTLRGTAYDDLIVGTSAAESIAGGAGDDWIHAGGGRDRVAAGPGADEIWTARGPDTVLARDRVRDVVRCGEGRSDVGSADRRDRLLGSCRRVRRG